jgi:hypothetical protein
MNFELPPWLQICVALATIVSSLGVIAAFSQIIVTINQFKKQVAISQKQLELTVKQFKSLNQGHLVVVCLSRLFGIIKEGSDYGQDKLASVQLTFQFKNTGNIPLSFYIEEMNFYLNNVRYPTEGNVFERFVVHPDQDYQFTVNKLSFHENGEMVNPDFISKQRYTGDIKIAYTDFNSSHEKFIDRGFAWTMSDNEFVFKWTRVSDLIDNV